MGKPSHVCSTKKKCITEIFKDLLGPDWWGGGGGLLSK